MLQSPVSSLAVIRSAIGASGWLAPVTASRLFGIDIRNDVSGSLFLRLGGSRDFALAAGPLLTEGPSRTNMLKVAAACDVGDILAVAIARRQRKISRLSAAVFAGASLGCLALGAKALAES
jgi:hypothetical protein